MVWGVRFNGGVPLNWSRFECILAGRSGPTPIPASTPERTHGPAGVSRPFAELHAVSNYSFLGGASSPRELVYRAHELGIRALGLVDRDGFYGAVQFAEAAAEISMPTVFGAELSLDHRVLTVLARGPEGYRRLSRLIAEAAMAGGQKGSVSYPELEQVAERLKNHCVVLADPSWVADIPRLTTCFGVDQVVREYPVTMQPSDADDHVLLDHYNNLRAIASARPAAATRHHARLAGAKRALSQRRSLADHYGFSHPMGAPWLRSGDQLARMLPGREKLIDDTLTLAEECAFTLDLVAPRLPDFPVPEGHTEMSYLRAETWRRAQHRYAHHPEAVRDKARSQIEHELSVIEQLNFPGYFLIVCDLVDFCARANILCQGRGSAANSAVCFSLGITNAEPIGAGLLFERFLSPERDGPPDIDIDIESGRREEVIQYVYATHGRERAAQVANVITYRRKGALRDATRALGYPRGVEDAWSKGLSAPPQDVAELAAQFERHPRHLGIHSGGMVICDRPIADVVPTEWARMEGRSVIQWDKDDAASAGLVKFDLLGLGMLEALHHMIDLVAEAGVQVNLWELDLADDKVYDMLSRADAVGVFQVESRAQLATLPRLRPREFFDLVVEVALIRPGPIQGGSVHPYIRRRNGEEPVTYDHPVLKKALAKTLGIPLFQEQLMQIAVDAAGFSGAEADSLRRAMGSKRSVEKMEALHARFTEGLKETNNITGEVAEVLWNKIVAFAAYGFPESHAQSFASLVYFSAWFKCHYPAQFCVGLLRAQPMGFYSPQSLIQDARRHGITILPVCVNHSGAQARVVDGAIRIGLNLIKGLGQKAAERIEAHAPYDSVADVARRAELSVAQAEALARAGALDIFGLTRRQAQWQAGVAATEKHGMLPGMSAISAPALPGMNSFEMMVADIASTGVSHDRQPMAMLRSQLAAAGVCTAAELSTVEDGTRVRVAGVITHRQRPQTASGLTFLGLEDETGLINAMISVGLWARQKRLARTAKALIIRGQVQNASGAVTLVADRLEDIDVGQWLSRGARDFR
ncbi:error-prone DNA polymerase [Corynebacterium yudongzhengii]|uniref:Error-prone DNA polymerase n=1 Tax=Corynebacterium yudongzhengii TaxID=2080740 RepID=A0A2U1T701_9CORY|nr:error-prone DNA polymerase [Corynebacterium yudongzhengii]AWB81326.1 error-prone DNA polymerase [Corynebacterium yudongzhengii]PWC01769.1 error-prone DNA polymerase [Corynebacterium yudongzhengii]